MTATSPEPHPSIGPGPYGRDTSPDLEPTTLALGKRHRKCRELLDRTEAREKDWRESYLRQKARVKKLEAALNRAKVLIHAEFCNVRMTGHTGHCARCEDASAALGGD